MTKIENLPAKLRETGLFCCWRYEEGEGDKKPRKVPYNPRTGGRAQSNNPDTFAPLEVAMAASGPYDGLGVGVFNSLGAIDIDHCIEETGEISEMAVAVMSKMQAYTEYSPSGRGLRILFNASGFQYDKAKYYIKNDDLGLEVYIAGNTSRFVTLTGNALTSELDLEERGEQLTAVLEKYMIRPAKPTLSAAPSGPVENAGPLDDMALIELAKRSKNGAEFTNLWAGDTSAYGGDDSRADMALCNALAFWTGRDAERVDRLFRQSGLMREKWDRPTGGSTYGAITVQEAVKTCAVVYDPVGYRRQAAQEGDALDWGDKFIQLVQPLHKNITILIQAVLIREIKSFHPSSHSFPLVLLQSPANKLLLIGYKRLRRSGEGNRGRPGVYCLHWYLLHLEIWRGPWYTIDTGPPGPVCGPLASGFGRR